MRLLLSGAVLALALALTGCGSSDGSASKVNDNPPAGTNTPTDDASDVPDEPTEEETTEEAPEIPVFGQGVTYDNGLTLKVSKPVPFKPTEYAAGAESGCPCVVFTVTVVNNTSQPYEIVGDYITLQSGNTEATQIFDSGGDPKLEGTPSTPLLPSREVKYQIGFAVQNPDDLVMSYQPSDYELEATYFTS